MEILYDESVLAKKIYETGFSEKKYNHKESFLLAKYFRHILKYKDAKIKSELIKFCKKNDRFFNEVLEIESIKSAIKNSVRPFIIRDKTFLTKNELYEVRKIKNFNAQKLYLVMLLLAKRNKGHYVSLNQWVLIKKILNIKTPTNKIYDLIHLLYSKKMLEPIRKKFDTGHNLLFVDFEGEVVFEGKIDANLYKFKKFYEGYCGGILGYCEVCESEFVKKSNQQKYCLEHGQIKKIEKHKRYNQARKYIYDH